MKQMLEQRRAEEGGLLSQKEREYEQEQEREQEQEPDSESRLLGPIACETLTK